MKNALVFLASLVFVAGCYAQTAQVIQLTPDETKQAAALYAEKAAVEAKIEALRSNIVEAHLMLRGDKAVVLVGYCHDNSAVPGDLSCYPMGWGSGQFEYSTDFKFIVPEPPQPYFTVNGSGCAYLNPGVFTSVPGTPTTSTGVPILGVQINSETK